MAPRDQLGQLDHSSREMTLAASARASGLD
jgi:hypothetical protein